MIRLRLITRRLRRQLFGSSFTSKSIGNILPFREAQVQHSFQVVEQIKSIKTQPVVHILLRERSSKRASLCLVVRMDCSGERRDIYRRDHSGHARKDTMPAVVIGHRLCWKS